MSLIEAAAAGDAASVARLLAGGADPMTLDEERLPVFLRAAESGHVEVVQAFLDAGCPVDAQDGRWGWTPLALAVAEGRLAVVELLLSRGADFTRTVELLGTVETVLTSAVSLAEPEPVMTAVLRAGADPNQARPDGWTPLAVAAATGQAGKVRALLAAGARVSGGKGPDPLTVAELNGHAELTALLREHGAPEPVDASAERLALIVRDIEEWLARHAPRMHERQVAQRGAADPAAVADLETTVGQPLPVELRAYFTLYGRSGGLNVNEYLGLSVERMRDRWQSLAELHAAGTFDGWEPRERFNEHAVRNEWWNPGWLPLTEDGGGNLYCVDLAPGEYGTTGQIIGWEMQGGPFGPRASSVEEYLAGYRDELVGGKYVCDDEGFLYEP